MDSPDRRLRGLCEGLTEAGWLVALAAVPLFLNPLTSRSFEPDKIAILQVLVLVMAGAWLLKILILGRPASSGAPGHQTWAIVLPVAAFLATAVLSTSLSVDRQLSWWGCYPRAQGTVTLLCLVAVFVIVAVHLRRIDQWRRVVFVVILTGVAVSLYALMQSAGTDPLSWSASFRRSTSTLGNPVFLGGYLLMAVFITVNELMDCVVGLTGVSGETTMRTRWRGIVGLRAGFLLFAVAVQVIALVQSGSRGPLLGLVAGMFVLFLIRSLQLRAGAASEPGRPVRIRLAARWAPLAVVAAGLVTVGALVAVNHRAVPARPEPVAFRLARTFDAQSRSARFRIEVWAAVLDMMRSSDPLQALPGSADPHGPVRLMIGYGPETLQLTLNRYLPIELVELEDAGSVPDRAHNAALDQLATTGLAGLASWLWLMATVLWWGVRGLLPGTSSRRRMLFWLVTAGSVLAAVAASVVATSSWLWVGLAAPAGLLLGSLGFAAGALTAAGRRGQGEVAHGVGAAISAVLLATVAAHLVEISFSFTTAATGLYFWFFAAACAVVGCGRMTEANSGQSRESGAGVGAATAGLLTAMVCVTLLFGLTAAIPAGTGLAGWLSAGAWRLPALILGSGLLLALASESVTRRQPITRTVLAVVAASMIPTLAFVALRWSRLESAGAADPLTTVESLSWRAVHFSWFLLVGVAAVGAAVSTEGRSARVRRLGLVAIGLTAVVALAGLAAPRILRTERADVFAKYAGLAMESDRPALALELARRSVRLAPTEDVFLSLEARAAAESAKVDDTRDQALAHLALGERTMVRAVQVRPLNPDNVANLARLRVALSERQSSPRRRRSLEEQAEAGFERALELRPGSAEYLAGLGGLAARRGDLQLAAEMLAEAVRRDERYVPAALALAQCHQALADEAASAGDQDLAIERLMEARRVLELSVRANPDSDRLRSALAALPAP